jgi:hypothetical protein
VPGTAHIPDLRQFPWLLSPANRQWSTADVSPRGAGRTRGAEAGVVPPNREQLLLDGPRNLDARRLVDVAEASEALGIA